MTKKISKIHFLQGEKIYLRPIEIEELPQITSFLEKWVNDGIVTYYMFTGQRPLNKGQVVEVFKEQIESKENIVFLIVDIKTEKPIGYAGLYEINETARKAELRILIGEKEFWGKGYGTETTELINYYGFDRLNLNRIYLGYTAANKGAGRAYEKAGYVYEGTLKEDNYRNSQYYDSARMAILRKDYYKKFYQLHSKKFGQKYGK